MLLTFGFGYWAFMAGMMGFTHYLIHTQEWMWRRIFFPLDFAAILAAVGLFVVAPRRWGPRALPTARATALAALAVAQLAWIPIQSAYSATEPAWLTTVAAGRYVGALYNRPNYRGTTLAVPPDTPSLTYTMARYGGVEGRHLLSEQYDPFYYLPSGYTYADHRRVAGQLLQCWLADTQAQLFLMEPQQSNYLEFVGDHPTWFQQVGEIQPWGWTIEAVHAPIPSAQACRQAVQDAGG
jgi:hypothetical protein